MCLFLIILVYFAGDRGEYHTLVGTVLSESVVVLEGSSRYGLENRVVPSSTSDTSISRLTLGDIIPVTHWWQLQRKPGNNFSFQPLVRIPSPSEDGIPFFLWLGRVLVNKKA